MKVTRWSLARLILMVLRDEVSCHVHETKNLNLLSVHVWAPVSVRASLQAAGHVQRACLSPRNSLRSSKMRSIGVQWDSIVKDTFYFQIGTFCKAVIFIDSLLIFLFRSTTDFIEIPSIKKKKP